MQKPIYQERGGLRKGKSFCLALNITWPLVKIEVFNEKIIIKYPFQSKIKISKKEIKSIKKFQGILGPFGKGIRILHYKNSLDPFLVFWSFSRNKLLNKLEKEGYPIKK